MVMNVFAPGTLAWIQSDSAFMFATVTSVFHSPVGSGSSLRKEAVGLRISDIGCHGIVETLGNAIALIEPDETLHTCRQGIQFVHRRNVGEVEARLTWGEVACESMLFPDA
jgi:hypothetical protein